MSLHKGEDPGLIPGPGDGLSCWYLVIQPSIEFSEVDIFEEKYFLIISHDVLRLNKFFHFLCLVKC